MSKTSQENGNIKPGDRVIILDVKTLQEERIVILDPQTDKISPGTEIDSYFYISPSSPLAIFALGKKLNYEAEHQLPTGQKRLKITEVFPKYRLE